MAEPDLERTEPMARLVAGDEVGASIGRLRQVFAELTDHLRASPIEQVAARLRGWDNYQRASLGRGETRALAAGAVKAGFSLAETEFEPRGEPGLALPTVAEVPALTGLDEVVRLAARLAIPAEFDDQHVVATLFLYRVLARAGQTYEGFLHRDIAASDASVGSVVFYPTVKTQNIEGAEFGVHYSGLPTEELRDRAPDITFAPQDYEGAALVLGYPHNLAHGVLLGKNPHPALTAPSRTHTDDVREFLDPHQTTFVKDMAVLTFTQTSAIEDDIP